MFRHTCIFTQFTTMSAFEMFRHICIFTHIPTKSALRYSDRLAFSLKFPQSQLLKCSAKLAFLIWFSQRGKSSVHSQQRPGRMVKSTFQPLAHCATVIMMSYYQVGSTSGEGVCKAARILPGKARLSYQNAKLDYLTRQS